MLFAILAQDVQPGGLAVREANREKHLEYARSLGDNLKIAGPLMTDDGRTPNGTILVVSASSIEEAKRIAENDPYAQAGLFEWVQVRSWNWTFGNPESNK